MFIIKNIVRPSNPTTLPLNPFPINACTCAKELPHPHVLNKLYRMR